jgi:hypothetical protein
VPKNVLEDYRGEKWADEALAKLEAKPPKRDGEAHNAPDTPISGGTETRARDATDEKILDTASGLKDDLGRVSIAKLRREFDLSPEEFDKRLLDMEKRGDVTLATQEEFERKDKNVRQPNTLAVDVAGEKRHWLYPKDSSGKTVEAEKPLPSTKQGLADEFFGHEKATTLQGMNLRKQYLRMSKSELEDLVRKKRIEDADHAELNAEARRTIPEVQKIADDAGTAWFKAVNDYLKERGLSPVPMQKKGEVVAVAARKLASSRRTSRQSTKTPEPKTDTLVVEKRTSLKKQPAVEFYNPASTDRYRGAVVSKSTKEKGKWQVTYFDPDGFSMDLQYKTEDQAREALRREGYQPREGDSKMEELMQADRWRIGNEKTYVVQFINELTALRDSGGHEAVAAAYNEGGLEAARLQDWHVDLLADLKPAQMFFALDTPDDEEPLRAASRKLLAAGFTAASHRLRCYVLIGHPRDTFAEAEKRLSLCVELGFTPMAMLWRDKNGSVDNEWKRFQRRWARPSIIHAGSAAGTGGRFTNGVQQAQLAI